MRAIKLVLIPIIYLATSNLYAGLIPKDLSSLKPWEVKFDSSYIEISESLVTLQKPKSFPLLKVNNLNLPKESQLALSSLVSGFNSFEQLEIESSTGVIKSFTAVIKITFNDQKLKLLYSLINNKYILKTISLDTYGSKNLTLNLKSLPVVDMGETNLVAMNHWNEFTQLKIPFQIDSQLNKHLALFIKYNTVFSDAEFLSLVNNEHYKTLILKGQFRLTKDRALDTFGQTKTGQALTALIMMAFGQF